MRGLNKSKENEELYQELGNKENKLFSSMKDVYTLTALIGLLMDEEKPFKGSGGDPIKESIFNRQDKTFFNFIAIESTKDLEILKKDTDSEEEKAKLIEWYSNAGIEILKEHLGDEYLNIDNLLNAVDTLDEAIDQARTKQSSSLENIIFGIANEF
ncbi:MAG: hypothetical protein ACRCTZ_05385 [Sarcina sp.]